MEIVSTISEDKWPKRTWVLVKLDTNELNILFNNLIEEKSLQAYKDGYEDGTNYGKTHPDHK